MAVRFILGRAGSGKTAHCLRAMAESLRSVGPTGPWHFLVVPEQASLQTERALLSALRGAGTTVGAVYSFRHLTDILLRGQPRAAVRDLSAVGRTMALQRLLGELRGQLRYFRSERLLPGLHAQLGRQIEEFIECGVTPSEVVARPDAPAVLQAKLHDLQLLYGRYLELLDSGFADPCLRMDAASAQAQLAPELHNARVWVDGFAGFTRQELRLLLAVARRCAHMDIALLTDADHPMDGPPDPCGLFAPVERTLRTLQASFHTAGVSTQTTLRLKACATMAGRFAAADLAVLEARLFRDPTPWPQRASHVCLYRAHDPQDELSWVVQHIRDLVEDSAAPLRYRDIAIITRRIEDHHQRLAAALHNAGIPHFIDRRVPFQEHAVCAVLRALLRAVSERLSTAAMRALIKSPLIRIAPADADLLENYIVAQRIAGPSAWGARPWHREPSSRPPPAGGVGGERLAAAQLQRLNRLRARLLQRLQPWTGPDALQPKPPRAWATALFETLTALRVPQTLDGWARSAEQAGDGALAERHRQAWAATLQLLDDLVDTLHDCTLSFAAFEATLEAGMAQLDIGLAPPSVDEVMVGSIERSRHANIQAAFVIGFNDGSFPHPQQEPQVLNDADRSVLCAEGLEIQAPRSARIGEERLLAYIALTRAAQRLYISTCQRDDHGSTLEPSPYLAEVVDLLPGAIVQQAGRAHGAARMPRIVSPTDLAEALALHFGARAAAADEPASRGLWNGLYERVRQRPDCRDLLQRSLRGLVETNATAAVLQTGGPCGVLRSSATKLATYGACPFKYFAAHLLELQPRPDGRLSAMALGGLYHELLDRVTCDLLAQGRTAAELGDDDIAAVVRRGLTALLSGPVAELLDPTGTSQLAQRMTWDMQRFLQAHRDQQRAGRCRTLASELSFGLDSEAHAVPAVVLTTPAHNTLELRGRIDRLDAAHTSGFVFDYKTRPDIRINDSEVFYGLDLQLLVYLLALEVAGSTLAAGRLRVGGAFYAPLIPAMQDVDHPKQAGGAWLKAYRPRGLFDERCVEDLDRAAAASGSSRIVAFARNKDGTLRAKGVDGWAAADLRALLAHARHMLAARADAILSGDVAVVPYRLGGQSPCERCDFKAVCRLEPAHDRVRRLPKLQRPQLLERLRAHG